MSNLGPITDPTSFLGFQIANTPRSGGRGPRGNDGCGCGCLPLIVGLIAGVAIAALWR